MTTLTELLARWDADEGKPYKGRLIDWDAYNLSGGGDTPNLGCMCAQGQALHVVGGWTPDRLRIVGQKTADTETAKLLNISQAHAVLLRTVNDKLDGAPSIVLTNPEAVLGDQWSKVLDFWVYLDGMSRKQWAAARDAAWGAAAWAGNEIQGANVMPERGIPFFFLPMFGFASPEDLPARPDNYGPFSGVAA